jgi:hypothetical protein
MAILASEITFIGSLGDLSAYRMRGSDKIIVRRKGGADKNKIKTSPSFVNTRRVNAEFGGRSTASKWIMQALWPLKPLADYNIAGALNALMKPIQALDNLNEWGKRSIALSQNPCILEGFSLNNKIVLESVIRTPISYTLSKEHLTARVDIPQLIHGINFHLMNYPVFKVIATLGIVPDLSYHELGYNQSAHAYSQLNAQKVSTEWLAVSKGSEGITLDLKSPYTMPDNHFSLVLGVGIAYGSYSDGSNVEQVKYAGCAKVLGVR